MSLRSDLMLVAEASWTFRELYVICPIKNLKYPKKSLIVTWCWAKCGFVEYTSESWQKKETALRKHSWSNLQFLQSLVLKYFTCTCPFDNLCCKWVSCLRDDEGRIDLNPPGMGRLLEVNYNLVFVAIKMGLYNLNDHRCEFLYNL